MIKQRTPTHLLQSLISLNIAGSNAPINKNVSCCKVVIFLVDVGFEKKKKRKIREVIYKFLERQTREK